MRKIYNKKINTAISKQFKKYLDGEIGPWDLQATIEHYGFAGWTGTSDGKLIVHVALK